MFQSVLNVRSTITTSHSRDISYINGITRPESITCLDHIFVETTVPRDFFKSIIHGFNITDYYTVILKYTPTEISKYDSPAQHVCTKRFTNYDTLNAELRQFSWEYMYDMQDINRPTEYFTDTFKTLVEKHTELIKTKKVNLKMNPSLDHEWHCKDSQ
ncbi:hypothetical protein HHI36_010442 [Cryptolaemus montrouzieri]|uniref:Uncharacterized protein n=1 Tax=Cryptolaemus montrouzieri TaxID=559131 RepID=A0ABD2MJ58_9CUCU